MRIKMKIIVLLCVLSSCLIWSNANSTNECQLSQKVCNKLESVSHALQSAVERSVIAIAKAVHKSSSQIAIIHKVSFKRIESEIETSLPSDEAKLRELLKKFDVKIKEIAAAQTKISDESNHEIADAVKKITHLLQKTAASARPRDTETSKIVTDDVKAIHKSLNDALASAHKELKEIVLGTVKRFNGLVRNVERHVEQMLEDLGIKKDFDTKEIENLVEENAADEAEKDVESAFDTAVTETESLIDEVEVDTRIMKRGLQEFWQKFKDAMAKIGRVIVEAAKSVWEKMKPIILEKLQGVGKVLLETAKMVIVKVGQEIITMVVQSG